MTENDESENFDEDIEEENEYYQKDHCERCEYCGDHFWKCKDIYKCESPDSEIIEHGYRIDRDCICVTCCETRIIEQKDGDCIECSKFEEKYPELRFNEIKNEFKQNNLEYFISGHVFKGEFPEWEYHLFELPENFRKEELIEVTISDFKILMRSTDSTILIFRDNIFGVKLDLFDKFKRFSVDLDGIFIKETLIEKDGGQLIKKDLILKFTFGEYGDYKPEYAILTMYVFKDDYDYSEAVYSLDKNKISINEINLAPEDSDKLEPLRMFFGQMGIEKDDFEDDGSFKTDKIPKIKEMIDSNLQKAQKVSANFIFFPEYSIPKDYINYLKEYSQQYKVWIVGGSERLDYDSKEDRISTSIRNNTAFIFSPNKLAIQKKFKPGKDEPTLDGGNILFIFKTKYGNFSILICVDFLVDDLLLRLKNRVDFILVPCRNRDSGLFNSQAETACVKNSCYIMINNTIKYSGCLIFGPLHGTKQIFAANEGAFPFYEVDLNEYHLHRTQKKTNNEKYKAILKDDNFSQQIS